MREVRQVSIKTNVHADVPSGDRDALQTAVVEEELTSFTQVKVEIPQLHKKVMHSKLCSSKSRIVIRKKSVRQVIILIMQNVYIIV